MSRTSTREDRVLSPEAALRERAKELSCLHRISQIINASAALEEMVERCVHVIPEAWLEPEQTSCTITVNDMSIRSHPERKDDQRLPALHEPIFIGSREAGKISVRYHGEEANAFLEEESLLLKTVAERIGHETERMEMIETLHAQREQSRLTLTAIGDAVITADTDRTVRLLNPAAEGLTGWSSDKASGRELSEVFHIVNSRTGEPAVNPFDQVLLTGKVQGLANHTTLIAKDGTRRHIADSASPIRDMEGRITGVILVFRDVSDSYRAHEQLKKSEELFAKAFDTSPFAVAVTRLSDGYILEISQAFTATFGYTPEEAEGRTTVNLKLWKHPEERKLFHSRLMEEQVVRGMEFEFLRKDGTTVIGRLSSQLLDISSEQCIISTIEDITGQRATEQALKESENIRKALILSSPLATYSIDLSDRVLTWNGSAEKIYGWRAEEVIGRELPTIPEEGRRAFEDLRNRSYQQEGLRGEEALRQRRDGTLITVRLSTSPLLDADGTLMGAMGVAEDITRQKEMEEQLQAAEANRRKLEFIINNSPAVAFHWRYADSWPVEYVSENISMFGYTPAQFYSGELLYEHIIHPDDLERLLYEISEFTADPGRTGFTQSYRILSADGRVHWVEDRTWVHRDDRGEISHLQGIVLDVSEQKNAEQERDQLQQQLLQAQKMESIGRLAGGVAHDYNNMLSVIMGYTELALEEISGSDEKIHHYLTEISTAARRTANITEQLLAFARKQAVSPKVTDIRTVIENMLKMLRRLIGEDITLSWRPGEAVSPVLIDPTQIDQLLANLCVNARDAIAGVGAIVIETHSCDLDEEYCRRYPEAVPGRYAVLTVTDTGRGMDEETKERIFEPFYTSKAQGEGTGLGLSMVYGIVKQNRGIINVYSEPGSGTSFTIYLPACEGAAAVHDGKEEKLPAAEGESILLVEDEQSIRVLTRQLLSNLGYTVHEAETPEKALEIVRNHGEHIDLLFTDVVMPGMNGKRLADRLTEEFPAVKVLFMSGYTADVIARRGIVEDSITFIQKPFTVRELAGKIRTALEA